MVEQVTVNTIIEPIINNPGVGNFTSPEMVIRKTFLMTSTTLLKDVCNIVMGRIGLAHLAHTTTAFIETPKSVNNNSSTIINKLPADLGGIRNFIGQPINIKIIIHGSLEDFVVFRKEGESCTNELLHDEVYTNNDSTLYLLTKEIIECIREVSNEGITYDYLYVIKEIIEEKLNIIMGTRHGCFPSLLSIVNEYFLNNSNINGYLNDSSNVYKKATSKFDPQNEEPILEVSKFLSLTPILTMYSLNRETTNINVIFQIMNSGINNNNIIYLPQPPTPKMNLLISSNTFLRDVGESIMKAVHLSHLLNKSRAYLQLDNGCLLDTETFFPLFGINITMVKIVLGEPFTIKIITFRNREELERFSHRTGPNSFFECPPIIMITNSGINIITIPNSQIIPLQINNNNHHQMESKENEDPGRGRTPSIHSIRHPRYRIRFHPFKETPILERWYQQNNHPTNLDYELYAYQLNVLSNRNKNCQVGADNIRTWFQNRRKTKRNGTFSMKNS